jgi:putative heme-binding domain-containing protein
MRLLMILLLAGTAPAQRRNPLGGDPASIAAGRQAYLGACSACHGATGEGSQGPSLLSGRTSRLPDAALFSSIKNGLPGTSMPNFDLPEEKVWQLAAFVRSLTAPAIAARLAGNPERGRDLFFGPGKCSSCHSILGQGGSLGPDLSNVAEARTVHQLRESLTKPSQRIVPGFRGITAITETGEKIEGVAKNQNNYSVQILDRSGKLHLLDRSGLRELRLRSESLMPPVASDTGLDDLLAFLGSQSTRPPEGGNR